MCRASKPLGIALAAAAALLLSGCATLGRRGPVPEEVATCRELTQQGVAAMELGDWAKAESLLERAVEASPVDSTSRYHFAETLWHRGATEEALLQNIKALADAVQKSKPAGAKGTYMKRVSVSSTMGPGVHVDPSSVNA